MLKVTNQEVHNCSQRDGWVGQIFVGAGREHPVEIYTQDVHILCSDLEHPVASWQPSRQHLFAPYLSTQGRSPQINYHRQQVKIYDQSWKNVHFLVRVQQIYVFRIRVAKNYDFFVRVGKIYAFLVRVINIIFSGSELEKIEFLAKFSLPELEKL